MFYSLTVFCFCCFAQSDMLAYLWLKWFGSLDYFFCFGVSIVITAVMVVLGYMVYRAFTPRFKWTLRVFWGHMLVMSVFFLIVGYLLDVDEAKRYSMRIEHLLMEGKIEQTMLVGNKSYATDQHLFMLRAYSLAKCHHMGDRLFHYPMVKGGANALLPDSNDHSFFIPLSSITEYSRKAALHDYQLCGLLLEKKLDAFVAKFMNCYDLKSANIPRHYQEALTLYTHKQSSRRFSFANSVLDADYEDFVKILNVGNDDSGTSVRDVYGNTYWYYYSCFAMK